MAIRQAQRKPIKINQQLVRFVIKHYFVLQKSKKKNTHFAVGAVADDEFCTCAAALSASPQAHHHTYVGDGVFRPYKD